MSIIASVAVGAGAFGMFMLDYTESAAFCGRCHTMKPELEAHERGPHREVKCGECHVAPGMASFVKAKLNGTKQLFQILTNTYPEPIHSEAERLPSPKDTCEKCHDRLDERPDVVIIRSRFAEDEVNTEQRVGVAVRLNSTSPWGAGRIHGHNELNIRFITAEDDPSRVDWIDVERPDGTKAQYISMAAVEISSVVERQIEAMKSEREVRTFGCTDCHNRAGHEMVRPDTAIDDVLARGKLEKALPYLKREALRILSADYPSWDRAWQAILGLNDFYETNYPEYFADYQQEIQTAMIVLGDIYRESADPEMKASYKTYPSNLGHQSGEGCFRCHDGAHVRLDQGKVGQETLAWECSTCHSFPAWGSDTLSIAVNQPPQYHTNPVWLFEHKEVAVVQSPVPKECSNCHTPRFCTTCHETGVRHDQMLFSHASLARDRGLDACTFCHQKVYCATCHETYEKLEAVDPRVH